MLLFLDQFVPPTDTSNPDVRKFTESANYKKEPSVEDITSGKATLRRGHTGPQVLELQKRLNAEGANPPLVEDGRLGPKTEAALRTYQKKNNLKPDGNVDKDDLAMIKAPSSKTISEQEAFKSLNADTKIEVTKALDAAKTPEARQQISDLATSEGFGKLDKMHQKMAIDALRAAPGNADVAKAVKDTVNDASFQTLNDDSKSRLLTSINARSDDKAAVATLSQLGSADGLPAMSDESKKKLINAASDGGENGKAVRAELDKLLGSDEFKKADAKKQAELLEAFTKRINDKGEIQPQQQTQTITV
jgi:hypothetical protein